MITIREDNTFVANGKIFQIDKDNRDGTFTSHLIGFEEERILTAYNETADTPLKAMEEETNGELSCKFCGKVCGSAIGLFNHEKACHENPDNKKGE